MKTLKATFYFLGSLALVGFLLIGWAVVNLYDFMKDLLKWGLEKIK